MLQGQLGVRVVGKALGHLFVAVRAGFSAHKIRRRGWLGLRGGLRGRRLIARRGRRQHGNA